MQPTLGLPRWANLHNTQATTFTHHAIDVRDGVLLLGVLLCNQTIDTSKNIRVNLHCTLQDGTALEKLTTITKWYYHSLHSSKDEKLLCIVRNATKKPHLWVLPWEGNTPPNLFPKWYITEATDWLILLYLLWKYTQESIVITRKVWSTCEWVFTACW